MLTQTVSISLQKSRDLNLYDYEPRMDYLVRWRWRTPFGSDSCRQAEMLVSRIRFGNLIFCS